MAHLLNHFRPRRLTEKMAKALTLVPIPGVDPHLEEFMVRQRLMEFGQYGVGDAVGADDDHRLPGVG